MSTLHLTSLKNLLTSVAFCRNYSIINQIILSRRDGLEIPFFVVEIRFDYSFLCTQKLYQYDYGGDVLEDIFTNLKHKITKCSLMFANNEPILVIITIMIMIS